jgi:3-oxoacyl-[acyl-carrier protein] reductase
MLKFMSPEDRRMKLNGKNALVTGGSNGIGRSICTEMAKQGANVALAYRSNEKNAEEIRDEITRLGRKALAIRTDVSDPQQVKEMVRKAASELGGLDIIVNCAGILPQDPIEEITESKWFNVLNVNLSGAFFAAQAAVPYLKQSSGGRIISITSQAAFTGSVDHVHYCAAKAGLLGMTYAMAKELGHFGITVNTVAPGRVETEMLTYGCAEKRDAWLKQTPLGRLGEPLDIARTVVFLASDDAGYITGANINVNGGLLMG